MSFFNTFDNKEENCTHNKEVDNSTQEATITNTIPWKFSDTFYVRSFQSWVQDKWSDDIIYKWSNDGTKSRGDDHTDSEVNDITAKQKFFKIF